MQILLDWLETHENMDSKRTNLQRVTSALWHDEFRSMNLDICL